MTPAGAGSILSFAEMFSVFQAPGNLFLFIDVPYGGRKKGNVFNFIVQSRSIVQTWTGKCYIGVSWDFEYLERIVQFLVQVIQFV